MACEDCKRAGDANSAGNYELAEKLHCGKHECTCQHRVGPNLIRKEFQK